MTIDINIMLISALSLLLIYLSEQLTSQTLRKQSFSDSIGVTKHEMNPDEIAVIGRVQALAGEHPLSPWLNT